MKEQKTLQNRIICNTFFPRSIFPNPAEILEERDFTAFLCWNTTELLSVTK